MLKNLTRTLVCLGVVILVAVAAAYVGVVVFGKDVAWPSATLLLDVAAGVVCLIWLLLILRVPWDIYFEAGRVLFEMRRSAERDLAVNPVRARYVRRLRWAAGLVAVGSHLVSAAIIAWLTYRTEGRTGYYFAVFYVVATFFRPASRGYRFLMRQLGEIHSEVRYPREDVVKLRHDVEQVVEQLRSLEESRLGALDEVVRRLDVRLGAAEEAGVRTRAEVGDVRSAVARAEHSFQERVHRLSEEVERSLMRAFDNRDIVNGLSAFAKLIKQA